MQFGSEKVYAFVGAKTSLLLNQADNQQEPIYGFLAGAGFDFTQFFRLEANGGYFYRGANPIQAVLGRPVVHLRRFSVRRCCTAARRSVAAATSPLYE